MSMVTAAVVSGAGGAITVYASYESRFARNEAVIARNREDVRDQAAKHDKDVKEFRDAIRRATVAINEATLRIAQATARLGIE